MTQLKNKHVMFILQISTKCSMGNQLSAFISGVLSVSNVLSAGGICPGDTFFPFPYLSTSQLCAHVAHIVHKLILSWLARVGTSRRRLCHHVMTCLIRRREYGKRRPT